MSGLGRIAPSALSKTEMTLPSIKLTATLKQPTPKNVAYDVLAVAKLGRDLHRKNDGRRATPSCDADSRDSTVPNWK